jgi:hypothetical protein
MIVDVVEGEEGEEEGAEEIFVSFVEVEAEDC